MLGLQFNLYYSSVNQVYENVFNAFLMKFNEESFSVKSLKLNKSRINKTSKNWTTSGIKISAESKRQLYFLAKTSSNSDFKNYVEKYKSTFNKVVKVTTRQAKKNIITKSDNKAKTTWPVVRYQLGMVHVSKYYIEFDLNNSRIADSMDVSQCFNNNFSNITNNLNISLINIDKTM